MTVQVVLVRMRQARCLMRCGCITIVRGAFTVGGEDLADRANRLWSLAKSAVTRRMTTVAVVVGRNAVGAIRTVVATSESGLRSEQKAALTLFEDVATGPEGTHAEQKAIAYLESQGYSDIIAVGASRKFCEECAGQIVARGLSIP